MKMRSLNTLGTPSPPKQDGQDGSATQINTEETDKAPVAVDKPVQEPTMPNPFIAEPTLPPITPTTTRLLTTLVIAPTPTKNPSMTLIFHTSKAYERVDMTGWSIDAIETLKWLHDQLACRPLYQKSALYHPTQMKMSLWLTIR